VGRGKKGLSTCRIQNLCCIRQVTQNRTVNAFKMGDVDAASYGKINDFTGDRTKLSGFANCLLLDHKRKGTYALFKKRFKVAPGFEV